MKLFKVSAGVNIFVLFAGIATLEFVRTQNWAPVAYFAVLALSFLLLDRGNRQAPQSK
jgi:hypothetical protein